MRTFRLLAVLAILGAYAAAARAESVMINHKEAKVRNGPGTSYTVLWHPNMFTPMELLAKYKDWYAVRDVEGDVGWIHDSVVDKSGAAIVTESIVDVHESADSKSRILFKAPKNYTFKVEEKKSDWVHVTDPDGDKGWVAAKGVWTGGEPVEKEPKGEARKEAAKEDKKEEKKETKKESKKESKKKDEGKKPAKKHKEKKDKDSKDEN